MAVEVYECPSCGATVDKEATECPKCGEIFEVTEFHAEPKKEGRLGGGRERLLFYAGVLLVLAGGPGIAVGSWLHDLLRIPIGGSAYEAFGWMNRGVAAVGLVVLIVGIVLLILSMRLGSTTIEDDYDIGVPRKT
ncbi:MAG: zinc ribbon domain-containing protein [Methanobacteriota archaeon]|nr:MAG: zinc ribbon domain-containing protein [Euryarchaeota archaeon]